MKQVRFGKLTLTATENQTCLVALGSLLALVSIPCRDWTTYCDSRWISFCTNVSRSVTSSRCPVVTLPVSDSDMAAKVAGTNCIKL